jgi:hypothetical protein
VNEITGNGAVSLDLLRGLSAQLEEHAAAEKRCHGTATDEPSYFLGKYAAYRDAAWRIREIIRAAELITRYVGMAEEKQQ